MYKKYFIVYQSLIYFQWFSVGLITARYKSSLMFMFFFLNRYFCPHNSGHNVQPKAFKPWYIISQLNTSTFLPRLKKKCLNVLLFHCWYHKSFLSVEREISKKQMMYTSRFFLNELTYRIVTIYFLLKGPQFWVK